MSITYDPTRLLQKIAPERRVKKLVSRRLDLKRAALSFIDSVDFIDKKRVAAVALKTVKDYKKRRQKIAAEEDRAAGRDLEKSLAANPRQLVQRVKNEVVLQISEMIREKYRGRTYTWLPSSANEPDPEHQLNYGKRFIIGEGEMPGERPGCQCGMDIDGDETQLKLD